MDINTYQYKELAEYMDAYLLGLVEYAVEKQLITAEDRIFAVNSLLDALGEGLQYLLSKLISMLLNLAVTYFLRDWINRRIQEHAQKKAQKK